jgi:hypothetical protein
MTTTTITIAATDGTRRAIDGLDLGRRHAGGGKTLALVVVTLAILTLVAF